jgi:hypothetical protein
LKTASAKLSPPQQPGTFATLSSYTLVMFVVPVAEKIHITLHYITENETTGNEKFVFFWSANDKQQSMFAVSANVPIYGIK